MIHFFFHLMEFSNKIYTLNGCLLVIKSTYELFSIYVNTVILYNFIFLFLF